MARRIVRVLIVIGVVIGLSCCGGPDPSVSPRSQGTPTATSPAPPVLADAGGG